MFCQDNRDKEQFLAEVLENLVDEAEFRTPLQRMGCAFGMATLALQIWKDPEKRTETVALLRTRASRIGGRLARVRSQT